MLEAASQPRSIFSRSVSTVDCLMRPKQGFKSSPFSYFQISSLGLKLARTGLGACFAFYAGEPLSSLETPLRLKLTNAENTNSIKNTNPFQPKFSRHLQHEHSALHSLQFMLAACRFKPHICICICICIYFKCICICISKPHRLRGGLIFQYS